MKSKIILCVVLVLGLSQIGWRIVNSPLRIETEKGIKVIVGQKALAQYESYWGLNSNAIRWDDIDKFAFKLAEAYGVLDKFKPSKLTIQIAQFDEDLVDNETPVNADGTVGREIISMGIDGQYWAGTIMIHLGDDTAQGPRAWCQTALDYELGHYFLLLKKDICWYYEFNPGCPSHYIAAWSVGLCK